MTNESALHEAEKCLSIARKALRDGDYAKAERFAQKAARLYPSSEVESVLIQIRLSARGSSQAQQEEAEPATPSEATRPTPQTRGTAAHRNAPGTAPAGMSSSHLRHRTTASHEASVPDPSTPEERKLVSQILKAKDLYEILGITKEASDDDIKKAYRKLALKLHPDKNRAHKADEAFKAVGKAFACLSDSDKRAYYDRTGYESTAAAQAAASASAASQRGRSYQRGPGGVFYQEEFDPEEIFNMFFGGLNAHGGRPFGPPRQARPRGPGGQSGGARGESGGTSGPSDAQRLLTGLFNMLPILLLVLFSFLSSTGRPAYSSIQDRKNYPEHMLTSRLEVPYFVKSSAEFERSHPYGSSARVRIERQVESEHYEKLQGRCQSERLRKHQLGMWGSKEE
ncbi:DnaJ-like protein, partial [Haematococcus lacustris]